MGAETSYDIKDSSGDKIMEGGNYESVTTYTDSTCVADGSYTFTIYDEWGDGICCAYGSGSYSVKVNDEEVASGGSFSGNTEEKQFVVDDISEVPTTSPPTTSPTTTPSTVVPTSTPSLRSTPNNNPPTDYPTHTPPTSYPTHRPPTSNPTSIPPTPFPTDRRPTPFPTDRRPTPFPTGTPPTLFPTHTPPTMYPTSTRDMMSSAEAFPLSSPEKSCVIKGESCTKWSDCCEYSCSWWTKKCR